MNVSHHYDISDELYDLFLDPKRQYSCAYFKDEKDSLETAQNNKIQHIIKKLNIKSNQKVLDIGCGWGSLAIDIAKSANCEVTGITLSENQFKYCQKKSKELNLENQVKFKLVDYRELDEKFDRIVSAGMLRYSTDGSKALVKYRGDQPSFLDGKTTYTHAEIMVVLRDTDGDWYTKAED